MADNYNVEVKITSHKKEVVAELEQAMLQALEAIGMEAEGHAQDTIRTAGLNSNLIAVWPPLAGEVAPQATEGLSALFVNGDGRLHARQVCRYKYHLKQKTGTVITVPVLNTLSYIFKRFSYSLGSYSVTL